MPDIIQKYSATLASGKTETFIPYQIKQNIVLTTII
jgi:hypothetical protein